MAGGCCSVPAKVRSETRGGVIFDICRGAHQRASTGLAVSKCLDLRKCNLVDSSCKYAPWFLSPAPSPRAHFPASGSPKPCYSCTSTRAYRRAQPRVPPHPSLTRPEPKPSVPLPHPRRNKGRGKSLQCAVDHLYRRGRDAPAPPAPARPPATPPRSAPRQPQRWYRGASWRSLGSLYLLVLQLLGTRYATLYEVISPRAVAATRRPRLIGSHVHSSARRSHHLGAHARASCCRQLTGAVDR